MIAFDLRLLIVGSSILLQIIAAFVALRIIIKARQLRVGVFILTAIILMVFRRGISLVRLISGEKIVFDMFAEIIALTVSVLLVIGVIYIERIIMKLKQAESERREKDKEMAQLHRAIASSNDAISILDEEGRYVFINNAHSRIYGYSKEEMLGKTWQHLIPFQYLAESEKTMKEILHNPEIGFLQSEAFAQRKDGTIFSIDVNATSLWDEKGNYSGDILITKDITGRKKTEETLRENEEKFSKVFRQAPLLITLSDIETGRLIDVNDRYLEISGFARDEVIGRTVLDLGWISEEPRSRMVQTLRERGRVSGMELSLRCKDGKTVVCLYSGETIMVNGQQHLLSMAQDITERKQTEERLRKSEEKLRAYLDNISDIIWLIDANLKMVNVSPSVKRMLDISPEELIGNPSSLIIHPDDMDVVVGAQRYVMEHPGEHHTVQYRVSNKNGCWIHIESTGISMMDNPAINGVLITMRDITERKQMEEALRSNRDFIESILNTVDEAFIVIDKDYRITMANISYGLQVDMTLQEIIGKHCYEISHQSSLPCFEFGEECAVKHCFETGEPHSCIHRHTSKVGSVLYVETKAFPLKDASGNVISAIEVINNITEKHLLEEERLKTQKLEAIGLLAGGIAHDFNNLLQGVFGYISMAKLQLDRKEKSLHMLEQAEKALHMSVSLTSQLLTFSKGGKPLKKKLLLRPMLENSVKFALSGSRVDYSIETDKALWMVEADEGQISQVIQNIVLNADQAMPLGGKIAITVKNVRAPHKGVPALLAEGQYVEIAVKDTGSGIPDQYIPRLFDPYFTTKERGSGLGLATSYSIIKNHGGMIYVKSELGKGSTFFIYLPAIKAEEEAEKERGVPVPATAESVRKGRILLMDDEELVRTIVGIMIGSLGHEVKFAENGEEAIAKYSEALSSGRRFDIVILDLTIRDGMGGEETLRELRTLDPEVNAVVSSGYTDSSTISEYESLGFRACLTKPYEVEALGDILNVLLK